MKRKKRQISIVAVLAGLRPGSTGTTFTVNANFLTQSKVLIRSMSPSLGVYGKPIGHLEWRRAGRKSDDVQRREGLAAHRVHVREGVGGGDAAESVGIVDDWRKEIHRLNERDVVRDDKDSRVVERLAPDEQAWIIAMREWGQGAREVTRTHLGGSTGAAGERGESKELVARVVGRHGKVLQVLRMKP